jgi:bifunctional NMN adenylyltransferase/nudix hydrolase
MAMSEFNGKYLNLPFKAGFFIGRFQHIHMGHEHIIDTALETCERLLILVGSAQKGGPNERDQRNPFAVDLRISLIENIYKAYGDRIIVDGIPDFTTEDDICDDWGTYLLNNVGCYFDNRSKDVDLMIYGNDEHRMGWFDFEESKKMSAHMSQLVVARGAKIVISSTQLRTYLLEDDFTNWCRYVNPILWPRYEEIRNALITSKAYEGEEELL